MERLASEVVWLSKRLGSYKPDDMYRMTLAEYDSLLTIEVKNAKKEADALKNPKKN